jgi:hypothetical protein
MLAKLNQLLENYPLLLNLLRYIIILEALNIANLLLIIVLIGMLKG